MTIRQERILRFCNWEGDGLEIGASFNPIASKKNGYHIEILDYLSREELIAKYRGQPTVPANLEELVEDVDYVWHGERYPELVKKRYDYIISSHLIEHIPDVIGHINDCCELLNGGGVYSLVVPDKRYTFDIMRKETTAGQLISRIGQTRYADETIVDYVSKVVKNGDAISWGKLCTERNFSPVYDEESVKQAKEHPQEITLDIHASVFTPKSFAEAMDALYRKGLICMPLVFVDEDTEYGEFFAVFQKGAPQPDSASVWAEKEHTAQPIAPKCHIDRLDLENGCLVAEGFASVDGKPPVETTLSIGRTRIAATRKMRPDLSQNINSNKYGFFCMEPEISLRKGIHPLKVIARDETGKTVRYIPTFVRVTDNKIYDVMSVSEREQSKTAHRERRMSIMNKVHDMLSALRGMKRND